MKASSKTLYHQVTILCRMFSYNYKESIIENFNDPFFSICNKYKLKRSFKIRFHSFGKLLKISIREFEIQIGINT